MLSAQNLFFLNQFGLKLQYSIHFSQKCLKQSTFNPQVLENFWGPVLIFWPRINKIWWFMIDLFIKQFFARLIQKSWVDYLTPNIYGNCLVKKMFLIKWLMEWKIAEIGNYFWDFRTCNTFCNFFFFIRDKSHVGYDLKLIGILTTI